MWKVINHSTTEVIVKDLATSIYEEKGKHLAIYWP